MSWSHGGLRTYFYYCKQNRRENIVSVLTLDIIRYRGHRAIEAIYFQGPVFEFAIFFLLIFSDSVIILFDHSSELRYCLKIPRS